ncbi:hypothetical protein A45J_0392 [hot springs metagenome]|uniref:Uncharacterized protein n=1 Tax=hot springs metagenome TaxID=433727 RepID=A0A5J4KTT9_9ZZZZ
MYDKNPIVEAWESHPDMRSEFISFLIGRYKSLFKRLNDEAIKVCLTDPD